MICDKLKACMEKQLVNESIKNCSNKRAVCIEASDNRTKVKCEERKKKYILENTMKNHVILYKMDGGIILDDKSVPQETCKCDYLFVINSIERSAILVELKGVDVPHSLKQIDGTLSQFKDFFSVFKHVYGRIVVASSTPNIKASPAYFNLVQRFRITYRGNISIVERQLEEKDIELFK